MLHAGTEIHDVEIAILRRDDDDTLPFVCLDAVNLKVGGKMRGGAIGPVSCPCLFNCPSSGTYETTMSAGASGSV